MPGDVIISHMCTKNNDHMMYGSDRRMDRKSDIAVNAHLETKPKMCMFMYFKIQSDQLRIK